MVILSSMLLFAVFFISLLLGSALLHTGVQAWQADTEKRWLARVFAALFTAVGSLLLLVSLGSFVWWW